MRCAAARDWRKKREVPRGRASRLVRWLGEKKGTALQSKNKSDGKGLTIAFDFRGPENGG